MIVGYWEILITTRWQFVSENMAATNVSIIVYIIVYVFCATSGRVVERMFLNSA